MTDSKIDSLVEALLELASGGDYSHLKIDYFQCGDESLDGSYTPPHYNVVLDLEKTGSFEGSNEDLFEALDEVRKEFEAVEAARQKIAHAKSGVHTAHCCQDEEPTIETKLAGEIEELIEYLNYRDKSCHEDFIVSQRSLLSYPNGGSHVQKEEHKLSALLQEFVDWKKARRTKQT